jgi:hypothetical protein
VTCPICNNHAFEIYVPTDDYAAKLLECPSCDALWLLGASDEIALLNNNAA